MYTQLRAADSQNVVRLKLKCVRRGTLQAIAIAIPRGGAKLLSVRRHLLYRASVDMDHQKMLQAQFAEGTHDRVVNEVRQLLNREFGRLRIYRDKGIFVVQHHSADALIAGLLRCRCRAREIRLPVKNVFDELTEQTGITLEWDVEHPAFEADL